MEEIVERLTNHPLFSERLFNWELSSAKANRICFWCRKSIKKGNLTFRRYVKIKYPPFIKYDQCCLNCGLKQCNELKDNLESFISNFKIYKKKEGNNANKTTLRPRISREQGQLKGATLPI